MDSNVDESYVNVTSTLNLLKNLNSVVALDRSSIGKKLSYFDDLSEMFGYFSRTGTRIDLLSNLSDALNILWFSIQDRKDVFVPVCNGMRGMIRRAERVERSSNKMIDLLSDVKPIPIDAPVITDYKFDPYDEFLPPLNLKAAPKEIYNFLLSRARDECNPAGQLAVSTWLVALRITLGRKFRHDPFVRMLADYVRRVRDPIGVPKSRGIFITLVDSASAVRAFTLVNAAFYTNAFRQMINNPEFFDVYEEIVRYLFLDPMQNTNKLKGWISIPMRLVGALSKSGQRFEWIWTGELSPNIRLLGYNLVDKVFNDEPYYRYVKKLTVDDDKEFRAFLPRSAAYVDKLMSVSIGKDVLREVVYFNSILCITGYTRTFAPTSHEKQLKVELEKPVRQADIEMTKRRGGLPFNVWLRDEVKQFFHFAYEKKLFSTQESFLANIPGYLTPSSSGEKPVLIRVRHRRLFGPKEIVLKVKSRRGIFFNSPWELLSVEAARNTLTEEHPGLLASRQVTAGKATRAVFVRGMAAYLFEILVAGPMLTYMVATTTKSGKVPLWMAPDEYRVGRDSPNMVSAMALQFAASGSPHVMAFLLDASKHDAHLQVEFRETVRDEYKRLATMYGFTQPILELKGGLPEAIDLVWSPPLSAGSWFESKSHGVVKKLYYTGLASGELATSTLGSWATRANARYIYERLTSEGMIGPVTLEAQSIMGDDYIGLYRIHTPMTPSFIDKFTSIAVDAAKANGMEFALKKSSCMTFFAEYLKKTALCGWFVPLLHLVLMGSENVAPSVDPIEVARGLRSMINTIVARGMPDKYCHTFLNAAFCMHRSWKMVQAGRVIWYYAPHSVLFTPLSSGGVGVYPGTSLSPNADGPLRLLIESDIDNREWYKNVVDILKYSKAEFLASVGRLIERGEVTIPQRPFEQGAKFVDEHMITDNQKKNAFEATKVLVEAGLPGAGDLDIRKSSMLQVQGVVKGLRDIVLLSIGPKVAIVKNALRRCERVAPELKISWVNYVTWTFGDVVEVKSALTPFAVLDDSINTLISFCGINTRPSIVNLFNDMIMTLRRDKSWPRHITHEMLIDFFLKPARRLRPDMWAQWLVAMGATYETAALASSELQRRWGRSLTMIDSERFSWNGQVLANVDLDSFNFISNEGKLGDWFVRVDPVHDDSIQAMLNELGLYYMVLEWFRTGVLRKVIGKVKPGGVPALKHAVYGNVPTFEGGVRFY